MIRKLDVERLMIAVLLENESIQRKYAKLLDDSDFTDESHKKIFEKICYHQSKSLTYDLVLAASDFGPAAMKFTVTTIAHPTAWFNELREINIRNRIIQLVDDSKSMIIDSGDHSVDVLERLSMGNIDIRKMMNDIESKSNMQFIREMEELMERARNSKDNILGVKLFFPELDNLLNGGEPGNLIIVAARPGMGKSVLLCNFLKTAIENNYRFVLWSLEMTGAEYHMRLVAGLSKNNYDDLRRGKITDEEGYNRAVSMIAESRIEIIERAGVTVDQLTGHLLTLHETEAIDAVAIDHMGLIDGDSNLYQRTSNTSMKLKSAAKNLKFPIVALSQLSRKVEDRGGWKIPVLSDLRESGHIEQDADKIAFIYRPSYYGFEQNEGFDHDRLIVEKNRGGKLGYAAANFSPKRMLFLPIEPDDSWTEGIEDPMMNIYQNARDMDIPF